MVLTIKTSVLPITEKLLRLGRVADNPNPFMVFYDSKVMGTSQASYDKALSDHYETLKRIYGGWIGPTFKKQNERGNVHKNINRFIQTKRTY